MASSHRYLACSRLALRSFRYSRAKMICGGADGGERVRAGLRLGLRVE